VTAHSKITSKGQVTIPKAVRDALGLAEGDELVFEVDGGTLTVRPARKKKTVAEFFAAIDAIDAPRTPQTDLTDDEAIGEWLASEDERIKAYGVREPRP
jgi:AbrB family looped-hinge helix DNA binding protein